MKKGETKLEIQQKTKSPQIKQEEAKTMHKVEQNKAFFKRESEEKAMNQGSFKKVAECRNEKEKGVRMQYVDTYSG